MDTRIQEYRDKGIQEFKDIGVLHQLGIIL